MGRKTMLKYFALCIVQMCMSGLLAVSYTHLDVYKRQFKKLCDRLYILVKKQLSSFLLLSNEGCNRCEACTYPEGACRMPEMLFPSLEGFGIDRCV